MKEQIKKSAEHRNVSICSIPDPYEKPLSLAAPEAKFEPSDLSVAKCHFCYRMRVDVICHHCGRYVCRTCLKKLHYKLYRLYNWPVADPTFGKLKPLASSKFKLAAHCPNCLHTNVRPWLTILLLSFLLMALASILLKLWLAGLILLCLSVLIWLSPVFLASLHKFILRSPVNSFGLPLFCKVKVELLETVKAHFNICEDEYINYDEQGKGELGLTFNLKPADRERIDRLLTQDAKNRGRIKLNAGFLLLEQTKNVQLRLIKRRLRNNLLLLNSEMVYKEFVDMCSQSSEVELDKELYTIDVNKSLQICPPKNKMFPILIKPRLVKGGCRFEIKVEIVDELRLDFPDKDEDEDEEEKSQGLAGKIVLDYLQLTIPDIWEVVDTNGFYDQSGGIKWEKRSFGVNATLTNYVDFRKKEFVDIPDVHSPDGAKSQDDLYKVLNGTYQITIEDWTLSQLCVGQDQGKPVFRFANGIRVLADDEELDWIKPTVKYKTSITGNIRIDLPFLVVQQVLTLADVSPKSCFNRTPEIEPAINIFENNHQHPEIVGKEKLLVAPSYHVINEIVDTLTVEDVYIKQIRETPGYMVETEAGGNQVNYWEIRGKYYPDELQPTDFHLVISGEAPRRNEPNSRGTLTFELSMRSYIHLDEHASDKYEDFKDRFSKLKRIIKRAAYKGRQVNYRGRRVASWEQEQQIERKLEQNPYVTRAAAILNSNSSEKEGHIFLVENGDYATEEGEWLKQWNVHPKSELPQVSQSDQEIDKWKLLSELELENNNG